MEEKVKPSVKGIIFSIICITIIIFGLYDCMFNDAEKMQTEKVAALQTPTPPPPPLFPCNIGTKQAEKVLFKKYLKYIQRKKKELDKRFHYCQTQGNPEYFDSNWHMPVRSWLQDLRKVGGDYDQCFGRNVGKYKGQYRDVFVFLGASFFDLQNLAGDYRSILEGRYVDYQQMEEVASDNIKEAADSLR